MSGKLCKQSVHYTLESLLNYARLLCRQLDRLSSTWTRLRAGSIIFHCRLDHSVLVIGHSEIG